MNARYLIGLAVLAAVAAGGWYYAAVQQTPHADAFKIGVILPLTGNGSDQGEWVKQGLELAAEKINAGFGPKVELLFQDNPGGDPKTAVSVYNQLRATANVPVVITWGSGVGNALTPLVNEDGVVQLGVATAVDSYSSPNDYTFRNFPRASDEGAFLAPLVIDQLGVDVIAIVKINNDYGNSSAEAFQRFFEQRGGLVTTVETFESKATDFRTIITKLQSHGIENVYLATYPTEGALFLKQAWELGLPSAFVASVAILGSSELFTIAGNTLEGVIVASPLSFADDAPLRSFADKYEKEYGSALDSQNVYSVLAYNALSALGSVLPGCPDKDAACLKDALNNLNDFEGIGQRMTFDENGDIAFDFHLNKIEHGAFVPLQ